MVPNLANVFYRVGSQAKFREEFSRQKRAKNLSRVKVLANKIKIRMPVFSVRLVVPDC